MRKILHTALLLLICLLVTRPAHAVPSIQEKQLDNGLRILLMEAHTVPMVSMRLTMPAGSRFDQAHKGGTASLLATVLTDHTAAHDHESWAELLDTEAIRLGADVDRDGMSISLTVLKEVLPEGIKTLSETLLNPGWDTGRYKLIKSNAISAARKALEEPGVRAAEISSQVLFSTHPYGHQPEGNPESLKNIQLADLKKLYQAQNKPDGSVLAVSGDVTMSELLGLLKPDLKKWKGSPAEALFDIEPATHHPGKPKQIEMQTSQTLSQFIRLGPARKSKDFFQAFVLNHMLGGGGFGSRLMEEVREKRGLVYGIYSYFVPLAAPGAFTITLQTRANQAHEAEALVRQVMKEMFEGNISRKQMDESKANLIGGFAQRMDSNRERVGLISMIGFYQMPLNYLQVWTEKLQSVTLADIKTAARVYMNPMQWDLIRVGPNLIDKRD